MSDSGAACLSWLLQRNHILLNLNAAGAKRPKKKKRFKVYPKRFSPKGIETIARGLLQNHTLTALNLAHHDGGDEGAFAVAAALDVEDSTIQVWS